MMVVGRQVRGMSMLIMMRGMSQTEMEMVMGWDDWNVRPDSKSNQIQALAPFLDLAWSGLVQIGPFSARDGIGSLWTPAGKQGAKGSWWTFKVGGR